MERLCQESGAKRDPYWNPAIGDRFGKLTVEQIVLSGRVNEANAGRVTSCICRCDCGKVKRRHLRDLRRFGTEGCQSCAKFVDLTGQRFGRLVVVRRVPHIKGRSSRWLCLCDCGKETKVSAANLKQGGVKSCRCRVGNYIHGRSGTFPMERFWQLRSKAEELGLPFNIEPEDIVVPTHCPLLGIELKFGGKGFIDSNLSVDKFIPELGYVKGNVWVISYKANRLKSNATVEEIEMLAMNLRTKWADLQRNNFNQQVA